MYACRGKRDPASMHRLARQEQHVRLVITASRDERGDT